MSQFAADRLLRIRWLTPVLGSSKGIYIGKCDDADSVACSIWQRRNASRMLIADNIGRILVVLQFEIYRH
jgi:hypothetical protein